MWMLKHNWIIYDLLKHLGDKELSEAELKQGLNIIPPATLSKIAFKELFNTLSGQKGTVDPKDLAQVRLRCLLESRLPIALQIASAAPKKVAPSHSQRLPMNSQALLSGTEFRKALQHRILRVIFREEKNALFGYRSRDAGDATAAAPSKPLPLRAYFQEQDQDRCGFLSRDAMKASLFSLQSRRFLADEDVNIVCMPFEDSFGALPGQVKYEYFLEALHTEKRSYTGHVLTTGILALQRQQHVVVDYCQVRFLFARSDTNSCCCDHSHSFTCAQTSSKNSIFNPLLNTSIHSTAQVSPGRPALQV